MLLINWLSQEEGGGRRVKQMSRQDLEKMVESKVSP